MPKDYPPIPPPRPRDNPEDMFDPNENYQRNKAFAKPGPYQTQLSSGEEALFQRWAQGMNLYMPDYEGDQAVYDMRGFWKAMQAGDDRARTSINLYDKRRHFPDVWKTPYAATFSNESVYAQPNAPIWTTDKYMLPSGHVIFDDTTGKWYGLPNVPQNSN